MSVLRALLALVAALAVLASLAPAARSLPKTNPANRLLRVPVDTLKYEHATKCRKSMTKGALALAEWLGRNTRGSYWGGVRCERLSKSSYSMHAEGRAVDWHLDASNPDDKREARRLLEMLFSSDSAGNENALARRMGIIEAIWDCRYYGFWMPSGQSKRYGACKDSKGGLRAHVDPTTAHRNHIHLSLSKSGARMRTSYWRYVWLKQPLPDIAPALDADPPKQTKDKKAKEQPAPAVEPPVTEAAPQVQPAPPEDGGWDEATGDDDSAWEDWEYEGSE